MDSIFAISLGFALRLVVDATSHHNYRVGGSLVGLWEGAVLYHFLEKWPKSVDPYIGLGFRLLVDFLFTESIHRLSIVLLWTALGFILSDVTPAFWYDKNLHRFYRRTRRFIRHFDWNSLKLPLASAAISRVRFYDLPPPTAPGTTSPPAPSAPINRRHSVPGNFPSNSYSSSTDSSTSQQASTSLRQPIPATSLPPSALRSVSQPKPSSNSSVSFDVAPPTSEPDDDSFAGLAAEGAHTPTPRPVPPAIIVPPPGPVQEAISNRTLSGDPASSTLPPPNIDLLPEIVEPREDPDPPPPFEARTPPNNNNIAQPRPRKWDADKLSVVNAELSDGGSARESIISSGNRNSIIVRADLLREQAAAEEKERDRLHGEHKKAFSDKRYPDAVRFKVEQEEANERAMNLHRRAAGRYFKAHNLQQEGRTIDVHRLKAREAVRRTEVAIRDALVAGDTRLRVICGRGNHSERGLPVLRLALTKAMEDNRIDSEIDPDNPGVILIRLPVA